MMSPFLLVAVLFVPRCVATPDLPVQAAADSQATQTDGTLDVRLDQLDARVKALTKLTQEKAVSAMKKCDGSRDYNERKENRCNKDKDCGGANQGGPKCQTRDCNYCTDGKTGAKCFNTDECADGYVCANGESGHKCRETLTLGCNEKCRFNADCASGVCKTYSVGYDPLGVQTFRSECKC